MGLYDWADTHWIECQIPQHYASAADLNTMLVNSMNLLNHWLQQLTLIWDSTQKRHLSLETIPMVRAAVEKAQHGVVEARRQLKPAMISAPTAQSLDIMQYATRIADRFTSILSLMKNRRKSRSPLTMVDEYDVQYLFEALLALHIDDIRSEEPGPSVGGGYSRVDTYLPAYRCFIEFKMTRKGIENNILRKQLADDFVLYGQDQRCDLLFVFVHDPEGRIENPRGFETQMSGPTKGISNIVVVIR
jgi:REase_DpnII-MboI